MDDTDFVEVMPLEKKPKGQAIGKDQTPFLPSLPATILVLGQCGSGKSSSLWSMLTKGYVTGKGRKSILMSCWRTRNAGFKGIV